MTGHIYFTWSIDVFAAHQQPGVRSLARKPGGDAGSRMPKRWPGSFNYQVSVICNVTNRFSNCNWRVTRFAAPASTRVCPATVRAGPDYIRAQ